MGMQVYYYYYYYDHWELKVYVNDEFCTLDTGFSYL